MGIKSYRACTLSMSHQRGHLQFALDFEGRKKDQNFRMDTQERLVMNQLCRVLENQSWRCRAMDLGKKWNSNFELY